MSSQGAALKNLAAVTLIITEQPSSSNLSNLCGISFHGIKNQRNCLNIKECMALNVLSCVLCNVFIWPYMLLYTQV